MGSCSNYRLILLLRLKDPLIKLSVDQQSIRAIESNKKGRNLKFDKDADVDSLGVCLRYKNLCIIDA